ncbi:MAG TPA: mannose-6-phosphate isomerase, class I, partial [Chitinophagaceae bacterium]|nr:mannose-6-phosphate isomerase, class I [Chitinophagaceae bacterium]
MAGIFHLKGTVKHYDWGGTSFIPELLDQPNETHKPFAEYWMGIHPQGISTIDIPDGGCRPLTQWTENLSYLLKVLDVKDMLSIQVHPSKKEAEKGFAAENVAGVPLDSPNRNYKDDNHKPELMLALSDFWLLHGFKPVEELLDTLIHISELQDLLPIFNTQGYAALYRHIMEMPQEEVNGILKPLVQKIVPLYNQGKLKKGEEDYWAAKAAITFDKG